MSCTPPGCYLQGDSTPVPCSTATWQSRRPSRLGTWTSSRRKLPSRTISSSMPGEVHYPLSDAENVLLADLTQYAIAARYGDPLWAKREATAENVATWITRVDVLLSSLPPMNRDDGLHLARKFKDLLLRKGYPVRQVVLFGSVAKGTARPGSDIDVAVITESFLDSRIREGGDILLLSKEVDPRFETVTLHPQDFQRPFFTLAREIERTGIEV